MITENDQLTPREHVLMENERDEARLTREHAITVKQLELAIKREDNQSKIELKKLEAKWSSLLRLPSLIIRLPILFILSIAYIISVIRKQEPPKSFWSSLS